jgi:DNA (cytosine-5)-methyltransferase 1
MKILNLYAGIGGNRQLWGDEHEITAVEYDENIAQVYRDFYPNDIVIVTDAHQYLLDHYKEYDFIWSSPPCPTHSRLRTALKEKVYPDMTLYQEIIFLQKWFYGDWVVENVIPYYKPLITPTATVDRHLIWSNKPIDNQSFQRMFKGAVTDQSITTLSKAYNVSLPQETMHKRKLLRNMVLPEMGLYILDQVTNKLDVSLRR